MTVESLTTLQVSSSKRKRPLDDVEQGPNKTAREGNRKHALYIATDAVTLGFASAELSSALSSTGSDGDSLFDEPPTRLSQHTMSNDANINVTCGPTSPQSGMMGSHPARRTSPPIPGLHFDPTLLLPEDLQEDLMWTCIRTFFHEGDGNQVMLFERAPSPHPEDSPTTITTTATKLPAFLTSLLSTLESLLRPHIPPGVHDVLFSASPASHEGPPRARQAIVNLYWPGEGITPHVDLLSRYGDGILGVSLGSGCAMQFARVPTDAPAPPPGSGSPLADTAPALDRCALYLPKGSVVAMTEEARYGWTHGIDRLFEDWVEEYPDSPRNVLLERGVRLSITFRWLLPGADILGSA